ncbi:MAG: alpha/beta fold hydrolase [Cyclobacteriaceae bacterium]|nr:alpha/beta fold hydrolase [Cyclobacteriaceae bacterium]
MNLFFRKTGEGSPLIILHGLFGSSDNWLSIAKVLGNNHTVYSVDQRNHGQSPHSDFFNYKIMANDLKAFIEENNIDNPIILGHSMGGKTAMQFAVNNPKMLKKLILVDIGAKSYPIHHDTILKGLNSINIDELKSRGEADQQLSKYVSETGIRQFLLKNIARSADGFKWKMNLPIIEKEIEQVGIGLSNNDFYKGDTLFIRGKNSNYILDEDIDGLNHHFPKYKLETIENAGHWLHAEQPEKFVEIVKNFIK